MKRVFLGYAVFYKGEPFPCSGNTVTKNRWYLRLHALAKLNVIDKPTFERAMRIGSGATEYVEKTVTQLFKNIDGLTLRRVYAE
jgi:hypothetical protein